MLQFLADPDLWLVLVAMVVAFFLVVLLYPPLRREQADMTTGTEKETQVVYVYAQTQDEAFLIIEKEFKSSGWRVAAWEYDSRKRVYIFVLER